MIGGRLTKATNSVVLATSFIKKQLSIQLNPDELRAESAFTKSGKRK
jgi:hypothetical protein